MTRFEYDPPARNTVRRYRHRPRPCPGCDQLVRPGDDVAVWGPLPYKRTARRRDGRYRPAVALAHASCVRSKGGTFVA